MRVLLLSRYGRLGASSRLRHDQFIPRLAEAGITVEAAPLLPDEYLTALYAGRRWSPIKLAARFAGRWNLGETARAADLIWVEKEAFPWLPLWAERHLLSVGTPVVVDYDDAWFERYRSHRLAPVRRLLGDKLDRLMAMARLVTVGNRHLAEHARAAGAGWVEILPTVLDVGRYPVATDAGLGGGPPVIGWIGSPATARYLGMVTGPLNRLSRAGRARVRVVGARAEHVPGLDAEFLPWSEAEEPASVAGFDIGIMPLPDTPWERGKCAYKLIQCMACGKPVVASPVGANRDVVEDGDNGFLADGEAAWTAALETLIGDGGTRRRFGERGRALVERRFCVDVAAPRLSLLLRAAASGKAPG